MSINIEIHHIEAALDIKAGYTLGLADAILIHAMARKLLAVMGVQPVVWASVASIDRGDVREVWPNGEQDKAGNLSIAPLFTAPPAPAVPDERYPVGGDKWGWSGEYNRGWNACRAAMLNHSGCSTEKVPDDTRRMDWLVAHHVEVRKPLLYGSEKFFTAQTMTDKEDDYHATSLREQIDAAMAAAPTPTK